MADMGLGEIGKPDVIFKRKFRWTFEIQETCVGNVPKHYVRVASRPTLTIEETEINFLNAKTWIPGKPSWETITITYYDVAGNKNQNLWSWLASVYDFTDPETNNMGSNRKDYSGKGILKLLDGCGGELEEWELQDMWPQAINFGELDYSASDICDIELTVRYSKVKYTPKCGASVKPCKCSGCN